MAILPLGLSTLYYPSSSFAYPWNEWEYFCERRPEELGLLTRIFHGYDVEKLKGLDGGVAIE
jgi:hypothetical protein